MWNSKKTIVVVALFGVFLGPLCRTKTTLGRANENHPTAMELLDKYAETQAKLQSFIIKSWSLREHTSNSRKVPSKTLTVNELRFDGERIFRRYSSYSNDEIEVGRPGTPRPRTMLPGKMRIRTYDGKYLFILGRKGLRILRENARGHSSDILDGYWYGSREVMGYFATDAWHDGNRIDGVLRKANSISVQERMERIGASKCYVIDAESPRGRYTVWIDPQHGYNIAKAVISRGAKQCDTTYDHGSNGEKKLMSDLVDFSNVRFRMIEDVWVPMEADVDARFEVSDGRAGQIKMHYKRTEVILNPDHEALRSFYPEDIPSGCPVDESAFAEPPDREGALEVKQQWEFRWEPKARFVANDSCRVVRNDPNKQMLPIVKVLPALSESMEHFQLKPAPSVAEGKHIVLCFWDINHPQSRELLLSLRDRLDALSKKGVAIIAVETSGAQTDKAHSWAEQNKLTFPVGAFYGLYERQIRKQDDPGDEKPVLSNVVSDSHIAWTIEQLPWLILTDKERIVTAEGFSLKELNEKIKENKDVEQ